jgi:hypothetical protein
MRRFELVELLSLHDVDMENNEESLMEAGDEVGH